MNSRFAEYAEATPGLFGELMAQPLVALSGSSFPKQPAIYVFYFNDEPVHVGRTRNLRQRLQGHRTNSHFSASFAFKRARTATGMAATYRKGEGRGELLKHPVFSVAFETALSEVKTMSVRYLVVAGDIDQYLLELYAALELGTSLTEFGTH